MKTPKQPQSIIWSREESQERFPYPMSPLGWSLIKTPAEKALFGLSQFLGLRPVSFHDVIANFDGYVYTRKGFFQNQVFSLIRPKSILRSFYFGFTSAVEVIVRFLLLKEIPWYYRIPGINIVIGFSHFRRSRQIRESEKITANKMEPKNPFVFWFSILFTRLIVPECQKVLADWNQSKESLVTLFHKKYPFQTIEDWAQFKVVKDEMEDCSSKFFLHDFNVYFLKNILFSFLVLKLESNGLSNKESLEVLSDSIRGLEGNFSYRAAADFTTMELPEWLKKYGHLTDNWDLLAPTLSELPTALLQKAVGQGCASNRLLERTEIQTQISFFDGETEPLITLLRDLVRADEELRAHSSAQFPEAKRFFKAITKSKYWPEFVDASMIYFMSITEIEAAFQNHNFESYVPLIIERQALFARAQHKSPAMLLSENKGDESSLPSRYSEVKSASPLPSILHGQSISTGEVLGHLLVVKTMADFTKFVPHKYILVVHNPNPTYAPYYSTCLGIISETGGILSHGALVARELGIPMISEIKEATNLLTTDDYIKLDGTLGTAFILSQNPGKANQRPPATEKKESSYERYW